MTSNMSENLFGDYLFEDNAGIAQDTTLNNNMPAPPQSVQTANFSDGQHMSRADYSTQTHGVAATNHLTSPHGGAATEFGSASLMAHPFVRTVVDKLFKSEHELESSRSMTLRLAMEIEKLKDSHARLEQTLNNRFESFKSAMRLIADESQTNHAILNQELHRTKTALDGVIDIVVEKHPDESRRWQGEFQDFTRSS